MVAQKTHLADSAAATATFSSSMMEHHIPASVLDGSNGMATVIGVDGTQFVFSISSDNVFRSSAQKDSGCSGWATRAIAADLLSTLPSAKVKTFAASYDPTSKTITIAMIVTIKASGASRDVLYVVDSLDSSSKASWIAEGAQSMKWQQVTFDSTAFSTITAQNLNTVQIKLLLAMKSQKDETQTAYVEVLDPSNNLFRIFGVTIPPAQPVGSNPRWFNIQLPVDSTSRLVTAAGQPVPSFGQGLYVLGQESSTPALRFVLQSSSLGTIRYPVPDGATAIASLVLPDESSESTTTELYVAGNKSLTIMKSGISPEGVTISLQGSQYITGTTFLDVNTNFGEPGVENEDALVTLYGMNSVFDEQHNVKHKIFYTHALYTSRLDSSAWSPVVTLLDQVQTLAPVINSPMGSLGFVAVSSSTSITSSTTYSNDPPPFGLVSMFSNPISLTWRQTRLPVPTLDNYVRLRTYTSKLCVTDPATHLPLANTKINIATVYDAKLIVNGASVTCAGKTPTPVTTDRVGCITICNEVDGIEAVPFSISNSDGNQVALFSDGVQVTQPYNPGSTISSKLRDGISNGVQNIPYQDDQGNQQKLVDPGNPNVGTANTAFQALNKNFPQKMSYDISAQRGDALKARATIAKRRQLARQQHLERRGARHGQGAPGDESTGMLLCDLARWAKEGWEEVSDVVVTALKDEVRLIVTFAEGIFHAVVETVEDAWDAIVSVIQWLGAEFEKVYRWLAFIFSWPEIKQVHNGLKTAISASLSSVGSELASIHSKLDGLLQSAENHLLDSNPLSKITATLQTGVASRSSSSPSAVSDPKVSWVSDQLKNSSTANLGGGSTKRPIRLTRPAHSKLPHASGDTFSSALAGAGSTAANSGDSKTLSTISQSASGGDNSAGSAIWGVIQEIGKKVLDGMKSGVDTAFGIIDDLEKDAADALNLTIDIPVLTGIYKDVVGSPPSVLDILALCAAIVCTVLYKTANPSDNPKLGDYVTSSAFQNIFSKVPSGSKISREDRLTLRLAEESNPALDCILGGVGILKGIAILAGSIGEENPELQELVSIATIIDNICNITSGCIGAATFSGDNEFADFIFEGVTIRVILLMSLAQSIGKGTGLIGPEAKFICVVSELVSSGLGVWALVDIINASKDASMQDWLDTLESLMAFPQCLAGFLEQPEIGATISILRMVAATAVGVVFLEGTAEVGEPGGLPASRARESEPPRSRRRVLGKKPPA